MNARLFLLCSLGLNVVLALGWHWSRSQPPPQAAAEAAAPGHVAAAAARFAPEPHAAEPADWTHWLPALRTVGAPPDVLARLVIADFERRQERRQAELQRRFERGELDARAVALAAGDFSEEQERELKRALGEEGWRAWERGTLRAELAVHDVAVSGAELDAMYEARRRLGLHRRELERKHAAGRIDDEALSEGLSQAESDCQFRMAEVLGPERDAARLAQPDPAVAELRRQFGAFAVEPEQWNALVAIQREAAQRHAALDREAEQAPRSETDYELQQLAVDAARDQAFIRILGTERFASQQKLADARYQTLQQFAPAWSLTPGEIEQIYAALRQQEDESRLGRARALHAEQRGASVDWIALEREREGAQQATDRALEQMLGAERFARLKRHSVLNYTP